jgi:hypothetical protein
MHYFKAERLRLEIWYMQAVVIISLRHSMLQVLFAQMSAVGADKQLASPAGAASL